MQIEILSQDQCADVLSKHRTGRLACAMNGQPYVVPITYAFSRNCIYSFSVVGQKIEWMRTNPLVCVEVFEPGAGRDWKCVIANGVFEEFTDEPFFDGDNDFAWKLLKDHADWWEPGSMQISSSVENESPHFVYYRVNLSVMTGRRAIGSQAGSGEDAVPMSIEAVEDPPVSPHGLA